MAKVLGPGFSFRAQGSVGKVQYRKTTRNNVVCLYRGKSGVVSAAQSVVRACMLQLSAFYHTLTVQQHEAWRIYGAAYNFRWGSFAYFTYINMPLARLGAPLLTWPPEAPVAWVSQYPPAYTSTYVLATTKITATYWPYYAVDPSKSVIGNGAQAAWVSAVGSPTSQRFHIDLGSAKIITRIYAENYHSLGADTTAGLKNFIFQGSNNAADFTDLVYTHNGSWVTLPTVPTLFTKHTAANAPDPQFISVSNAVAYRYYAFKLVDNYGFATTMGVRRLTLQLEVWTP